MKIKTIALVASALIGAVGTTSSFAADHSCGAGSCAKKGAKSSQCDSSKENCEMQNQKKDQACGAGSCAKKSK